MSRRTKQLIFLAADLVGLPLFFRHYNRRGGLILLYHGVYPEGDSKGIFNYRKKFIPPESFREHLVWIKKRYTVLPLSTLIERMQEKKGFPKGAAAITFDDGYENIYTHAYPILKELDLPATVFLPTDFIERKKPLWVDRLEYAIDKTKAETITIKTSEGSKTFSIRTREEKIKADDAIRAYLKKVPNNEKESLLVSLVKETGWNLEDRLLETPYRPLSWEQIRKMRGHGIVFAAHTESHPIVSRLPRAIAEKEMVGSRELIEKRIGTRDNGFAYPNGQSEDFTKDTISILKKNNFTYALTTVPGVVSTESNLYSLPRITLDGSKDMRTFRLKVSGTLHAMNSITSYLKPKKVAADLFFHQTAEAYLAEYDRETPEGFSFRERKRIALQMLAPAKGKHILDIGSGPGIFIEELLKEGARITAVDLAPGMIDLLKSRFNDPRLKAELGDIENMNFPAGAFDSVTALGVLEYLETDKKAMDEMARVLKPGGEAIVSFPNVASPWRLWNRFVFGIFGLPWRIAQKLMGREAHPVTHREYTMKKIRAEAERAGFEVLEIAGYNFKLTPLPLDKMFPKLTVRQSRLLVNLQNTPLKWLATAYVARLRKI